MNKLDQLRKLLTPPTVTRGKVVDVTGSNTTIATRKGSNTARISPGLLLSPGQHVQIKNGLVTGVVRDPASLPVYDL